MDQRTSDQGQAHPAFDDTDDPHSVAGILARLAALAGDTRVSVGTLVDALGQRTYGPLLFTIGVIALSPLGAIPGASVICATLIVLTAVQMSLRAHAPWLPDRLRRLDVDGARGRRAIAVMAPRLRWLDRLARPRWHWLLAPPLSHAVALGLCLLATLMYPLALVPFGVMPVAAAVTVIGLGLLCTDGLVIAAALAVTLAAAVAVPVVSVAAV
jgi:hypothetical protein